MSADELEAPASDAPVMATADSAGLPMTPPEATAVFGRMTELAERYAQILAVDGVARGLLGPREVDRIWPRHLLNCAVVADLLPRSAHIVDVGSGAGLPGLAMAIRRPDLMVTLVEPLQRRVDFLTQAIDALGLVHQVGVLHGRAEDAVVRVTAGEAGWVTARAVAPLDRLVRWCLPLLRPGGTLLALKGASAADEVERHRLAIHRHGGRDVRIVRCGEDLLTPPTTVVTVRRSSAVPPKGR